ncbi:MAG: hypothetical protein IVW51_06210 [Thermaceae bacterium]|nr:hypothetical protein [Thermaceae bacterium]
MNVVRLRRRPKHFMNFTGLTPEQEYLQVNIEKPIRNQHNHRLTPLAKAWNQVQSRARLPVEHMIAKLEKFKILAGEYSARLHTYNPTLALVSGLVNFKTLGKLAW